MQLPTGSATLDAMLGGGYPANRSILLSGKPGTGKSTLAMQYLDHGAALGERGVFISTEQTPEEIEGSFGSFDFDLDHENLAVATIHATSKREGRPDTDESSLRLRTLEGGKVLDEQTYAFTIDNLVGYLRQGGPADRVVFDSLSGLRAIANDQNVFRRGILDMIRLFSDEFEATSVFVTEEEQPSTGLLKHNAHGVIKLWRAEKGGEDHHYLKIEKMRGIPHDKRRYELEFDSRGVHIIPRLRTQPIHDSNRRATSTALDGLDTLTDGGLIPGGLNVLLSDGRAITSPMLTQMQKQAIRDGFTLCVVPPAQLTFDRLQERLHTDVGDVNEMLDAGRLIILDMVTEREPEGEGDVVFAHFGGSLSDAMSSVFEIADDRPLFATVPLDPLISGTSGREAREARYWSQANLVRPYDVILYQMTPSSMQPELSEFYVETAQIVLDTFLDDSGIQYVKLAKAPRGYLGSERVVEYVDDEPYVRIQTPPL